MLWQYTEILFAVAGLATILSFYKNIDDIGRVFFLFVGAASWWGFAISLLKINFRWAGAQNVVSYTYIPSSESGFIYLFLGMGVIMLFIGLVRAVELVYEPMVSAADVLASRNEKF